MRSVKFVTERRVGAGKLSSAPRASGLDNLMVAASKLGADCACTRGPGASVIATTKDSIPAQMILIAITPLSAHCHAGHQKFQLLYTARMKTFAIASLALLL